MSTRNIQYEKNAPYVWIYEIEPLRFNSQVKYKERVA